MTKSGFDGFMLANNHIADYGEYGLQTSIERIIQAGCQYVGAGCEKFPDPGVLYYTINEAKIGIVNAAESQFGTFDSMSAFLGSKYGYRDCFGYDFIELLKEIKQKVDVLICVVHAGLENAIYPLPQFRELYRFFCDMGADCVIAHHPHVIQGYEDYQTKDCRETRIFYSLGNFFFSLKAENFDPMEQQGLSVIIKFAKQKIAEYELIFSQQIDNNVQLLESSNLCVPMQELCQPLLDERLYKDKILAIIKQHYPYYMGYYESIFLSLNKKHSLAKNLKTLIKSIFFAHRHFEQRQALLLHNINVPTHRFVQELYLKHHLYHKA